MARALQAGAVLVATVLGGCGGGDGSSAAGEFLVESVSIPAGAVWKLNRPIDVRFSADVDFATVNANTIPSV